MPELKTKPESPKRQKQSDSCVLNTDALELFDRFESSDFLIFINQLRTDGDIFIESD